MTDIIKDISRACCFTGHREITFQEKVAVKECLEKELEKMLEYDYRDFICGGALGFDTLAALCVLRIKRKYPGRDINLHLFLPCRNQTRGWSADDVAIYEALKKEADSVTYISESYCRGCMHKRNRAMVDSSGYVISFCKKTTGGTAYTVKYALENQKWVNLLPFGKLSLHDFKK